MKRYLESGDEAEMIEQSPREVGFILPVFSPKQFAFSFFSVEQLGFLFSLFEDHISSPSVRIPLQGVKGAIKARLEHA